MKKETKKAIKEAREDKDLKSFKSVESLFKDLTDDEVKKEFKLFLDCI